MITPGSTYVFGISQSKTNQDIISAVSLVDANATTKFELLIRNTGQADIVAKMWQSADNESWTQLKNPAGSDSSVTVSPGGQGTFVGIVTITAGYIKATGYADLTEITIPNTYGGGGTVTPLVGGNAKFLGLARDPMGN